MEDSVLNQSQHYRSGEDDRKKYLKILIVYLPFYFALIFVISLLRYLNFYTADADLGINMQGLWTTTHGMLMFDSSDFEIYGMVSHLEVHTSFIAVLFAYPYLLFPGPSFLFLLQDSAISLSVIILYMLCGKVTGDYRISFMVAVSYSVNATLLGAVFYDFHWLSFIPLESFVLFYALFSRWKLVSIITIAVGSLTQEIFPFIALSFLLYYFIDTRRKEFPSREWFFSHDGDFFMIAAIFSLSMYIVLSLVQEHFIPVLLNNTSISAEIGANSSARFIPSALSPLASLKSLSYWMLSFLLLLFLPLLKTKNILLMLPWMYETIVVDPAMGTLGNQYSFVTLSVLIPAVVVSLSLMRGMDALKIKRYLRILLLISGGVIVALVADGLGMNPIDKVNLVLILAAEASYALFVFGIRKIRMVRSLIRKFNAKKAIVTLFVATLSMSLILSPFNTVNDNRYNLPGYEISYSVNPQSAYIPLIQSFITPGSTIVASDNLFPIVANHDKAYEFYNTYMTESNARYFPFNGSVLPRFILYDSYQSVYMPSWVIPSLNHYGLVLLINGTGYPGNIYLYELGYSAPTIYE